jgi:hypothetical protein
MNDFGRGFGLDIEFINHLQVVTTNDYHTIIISTFYKWVEHGLSLLSPLSLIVSW